jgi:hypothetical protein
MGRPVPSIPLPAPLPGPVASVRRWIRHRDRGPGLRSANGTERADAGGSHLARRRAIRRPPAPRRVGLWLAARLWRGGWASDQEFP